MDAGAGEDRVGAGGGEGVFGEEDGGGGGFHAVEGGLGGFSAVFGVAGLVVGDALECPDGLSVCFDLGVGDTGNAAGHRDLLLGSVDGYPLRAILPPVMRKCKCHFGVGEESLTRFEVGGRSACVPDGGGLGSGGGKGRDAGGCRASEEGRSGCGGGVRWRGGRLQGRGEGLQGGEQGVHRGEQGVHSGEEGIHSGEEGIHSGEQGIHPGEGRVHRGEEGIQGGEEGIHWGEQGVHSGE